MEKATRCRTQYKLISYVILTTCWGSVRGRLFGRRPAAVRHRLAAYASPRASPARPRGLPSAGAAPARRLLLGRLLRLHQAAPGGGRPPPARADAGLPKAGVAAGRDR